MNINRERLNPDKLVGVVGSSGDLGRQVAGVARERGFTVLSSDTKASDSTSLQTIMDESDIVHFCIPPTGFEHSHTLRRGQLILLHDSVMATSEEINDEHFEGQADIVHMLMNANKSVVIEQNNPHKDHVKSHVGALGLKAIEMSASEHDHIMAHSQAPLAILVQMLLPDLKQWQERGFLTPSGDALLSALDARAANWTDQTMNSLLRNPELSVLVEGIQTIIEAHKDGK